MKKYINPVDEMKELVEELNEAITAYRSGSALLMSDEEYDAKYGLLENLEVQTGVVLSTSPTLNPVQPDIVWGMGLVKHDFPMMSLLSTKSLDDVVKFVGRNQSVVSYKIDGISLILKYDKGELQYAATRGSGDLGSEVTNMVPAIHGIPQYIPYEKPLVVRGEVTMSDEMFKIYSDEKPEYKNPRQLVVGSFNNLYSLREIKKRNMEFLLFKVYGFQGTVLESYDFARELGFDIVHHELIDNGLAFVVDTDNHIISNIPSKYPIDGLVIEYNDLGMGDAMGYNRKGPKSALAFKFKDEYFETKMVDVEWNISKNGFFIPVAVFEPVDINGTIVMKSSLHNYTFFEKKMLGKGDRVTMFRANQVGSVLHHNLTCSGTFKAPTICPHCGEQIIDVITGLCVQKKCPNIYCTGRLSKRILHFCSTMKIKGLSNVSIVKLINGGYLSSLYDIYNLKEVQDEIVDIGIIGRKTLSNILNEIEKSRYIPMSVFIHALGIDNVGLKTAKLLSIYFKDVETVLFSGIEEYADVKGVYTKTIDSIIEWREDVDNVNELSVLLNHITFMKGV